MEQKSWTTHIKREVVNTTPEEAASGEVEIPEI